LKLIDNNNQKYFTDAFTKKLLKYILLSIIVGLIAEVVLLQNPRSGVYRWEILLHSFLGIFGVGFLAPLNLSFGRLIHLITSAIFGAFGMGVLPLFFLRLFYYYYDKNN